MGTLTRAKEIRIGDPKLFLSSTCALLTCRTAEDNKAYDPYIKNAAGILAIWVYHGHLSFDANENLVFVMDERLMVRIEELGDKLGVRIVKLILILKNK